MTVESTGPLDAHSITTERLELRPLTREEVETACRFERLPQFHPEFPTPDALDVLQVVQASGEFFFTESPYAPMACVERSTGLIIGIAGWAAPPIDEALEIEGFLVPSCTGQGYATEALPRLVELGLQDPRVDSIRISLPDNRASLGPFLERFGFTAVESAGTEAEYRYAPSRS